LVSHEYQATNSGVGIHSLGSLLGPVGNLPENTQDFNGSQLPREMEDASPIKNRATVHYGADKTSLPPLLIPQRRLSGIDDPLSHSLMSTEAPTQASRDGLSAGISRDGFPVGLSQDGLAGLSHMSYVEADRELRPRQMSREDTAHLEHSPGATMAALSAISRPPSRALATPDSLADTIVTGVNAALNAHASSGGANEPSWLLQHTERRIISATPPPIPAGGRKSLANGRWRHDVATGGLTNRDAKTVIRGGLASDQARIPSGMAAAIRGSLDVGPQKKVRRSSRDGSDLSLNLETTRMQVQSR